MNTIGQTDKRFIDYRLKRWPRRKGRDEIIVEIHIHFHGACILMRFVVSAVVISGTNESEWTWILNRQKP